MYILCWTELSRLCLSREPWLIESKERCRAYQPVAPSHWPQRGHGLNTTATSFVPCYLASSMKSSLVLPGRWAAAFPWKRITWQMKAAFKLSMSGASRTWRQVH